MDPIRPIGSREPEVRPVARTEPRRVKRDDREQQERRERERREREQRAADQQPPPPEEGDGGHSIDVRV